MKKDRNMTIPLLLLFCLDVFIISTHAQDTETSELLLCSYNETGKSPIALCDHCQEYYVCKYENDSFSLEIHICPPAMIFSPLERECINSSEIIEKHMQDVVNASEAVWSLVKNIDSHEETILSTLPLPKNSDYHEKFDSYISEYNTNLEAAKTYMRAWRSGYCIVGDIKLLFTKVKEYEEEFDRMFDICKNLMSKAENKSEETLQILMEKQNAIKEDLNVANKQI